jgi:hypothetical protein
MQLLLEQRISSRLRFVCILSPRIQDIETISTILLDRLRWEEKREEDSSSSSSSSSTTLVDKVNNCMRAYNCMRALIQSSAFRDLLERVCSRGHSLAWILHVWWRSTIMESDPLPTIETLQHAFERQTCDPHVFQFQDLLLHTKDELPLLLAMLHLESKRKHEFNYEECYECYRAFLSSGEAKLDLTTPLKDRALLFQAWERLEEHGFIVSVGSRSRQDKHDDKERKKNICLFMNVKNYSQLGY